MSISISLMASDWLCVVFSMVMTIIMHHLYLYLYLCSFLYINICLICDLIQSVLSVPSSLFFLSLFLFLFDYCCVSVIFVLVLALYSYLCAVSTKVDVLHPK